MSSIRFDERRRERAASEWSDVATEWTYPFDDWFEAPPRWEYPMRGPFVCGETAAPAIVAGDQAESVAFCYRPSSQEPFILPWPGLNRNRDYEVEIDGGDEHWRRSGAELGDAGLKMAIPVRHWSALLIARRSERSRSLGPGEVTST